VDQQVKSGLNQQQAFEGAVQRIGQAGALRNGRGEDAFILELARSWSRWSGRGAFPRPACGERDQGRGVRTWW
jgi:hypothetical protein